MKSSTVLNDVLICPATLWREDSVRRSQAQSGPGDGAATPERTHPSDYSHVVPPCALQPRTGTSER
jgi:hypothetical protein